MCGGPYDDSCGGEINYCGNCGLNEVCVAGQGTCICAFQTCDGGGVPAVPECCPDQVQCGLTSKVCCAPFKISTLTTSGQPKAVEARGTMAYVAAGTGDFRIFDFQWAQLVGYRTNTGDAMDISVNSGGTIAAVGYNGGGGLVLYDINDPAQPLKGSYSYSEIMGVHFRGDEVFAIDEFNKKLFVGDAQDYDGYTELGQLNLTVEPRDVFTFGNTAYLPAGNSGLAFIDITQLDGMTQYGSLASAGSGQMAEEVVVAGIPGEVYAFVADGGFGLVIWDVTSLTLPPVKEATVGCNARSVALAGNQLFLGCGGGGFQVWDVAVPSTPKFMGALSRTATSAGVSFDGGGKLIVAEETYGLSIFNVGSCL